MEFQFWLDLGRKIKVAAQGSVEDAAPGVMMLDVETAYDPGGSGEFPSDYTPGLVKYVQWALPAILGSGSQEAREIVPPLTFPDLGDLRIVARYFPSGSQQCNCQFIELSVDKFNDLIQAGSIETIDVGTPVSEGPPTRRTQFWEEKADSMLGPPPGGYDELTQELAAANHGFRKVLARRLEDPLNTHIQKLPHESYAEKKKLAKWVNDELRRFGLAIKCPRTGNPAILVAGPGDDPDTGRFQLDILTPEGKRKRTLSSVTLPFLELTEAATRRGPEANWADRITHAGNQGTGTPS